MAEQSLDRRILREIRERLKASRAAVAEYHRLEAALRALDATNSDSSARPRAQRRSGATANKRAPRGANRDKALLAIDERAGITISELSSVTGIAKTGLYSITRTLAERGVIERVTLPGDTIGFRTSPPTDADPEPAGDRNEAPDPAVAQEGPKRSRRSRTAPPETDTAADTAPQDPAGTQDDTQPEPT